MNKKIYILILLTISISCKKSIFTCNFSGEKSTKNILLNDFDKVEVNPLIDLTIYHSVENKMEITTDRDVIQNIDYKIVNNKLIITNTTDCTVQNSDAVAYIKLYVDDISEIIANTDLDVHSGNIWHFNRLKIICENAITGTNNIADFDIEAQINHLSIVANGSSVFDITGTCRDLFVGFYGVNPIINGQNFKADKIRVFQRSDADMHLYPVNEISGDLYGYGDIYLYHRPPVVNITEHYAGNIYFVN
jgi:hypothetical protein